MDENLNIGQKCHIALRCKNVHTALWSIHVDKDIFQKQNNSQDADAFCLASLVTLSSNSTTAGILSACKIQTLLVTFHLCFL